MEPAVEVVTDLKSAGTPVGGAGASEAISLVDAAGQLGVHYMTAYRYVRTGRLAAVKERGQWWVTEADIASFEQTKAAGGSSPVTTGVVVQGGASPGVKISRRRYATQLRRRLVVGDDAGAWAVVTEALASGAEPQQIHLDIIGPAMEEIGDQWAAGELSISEEHLATAVVQRLLGRMTPMFRHAGRTRATVVLGAVSGDPHAMPAALMSDLLHDRNFSVVNLGANTPAEAFLDVLNSTDGAVAVGLFAVMAEADDIMRSTVELIRAEYPDVAVILGGPTGARIGPKMPDVQWSTSTGHAMELFEAFRSVET